MDQNQSIKNTYEVHGLTDIPVIFHHNKVRSKTRHANWHENVEILHFTAGRGTVVCEDRRISVGAGDISVIDSGLLHRVESDCEVQYDCLIVDEAFCHSNGLFPDAATFPLCIRDEALTLQYNKVAAAFDGEDIYRTAELRAAALSLMVMLMRHHSRPANASMRDSNSAVRMAVGYIRSHYSEPLELEQLAAEVGLSKYHFLRKFKEATGQTVISYINAVRIEHAERLLREGKTSVGRVAEACGFANHSYFSKVFFRLRGVLPSEIK